MNETQEQTLKRIGFQLKMRLAELEMTQAELAQRLKGRIVAATVNNIFNGKRPYSIGGLIAIAGELGIEVSLRMPPKEHKDVIL